MSFIQSIKIVFTLVLAALTGIPAMAQKKKPPQDNISLASDYFIKASKKAKAGDYVGAVLLYDKAIALDKESYETYYNRGYCKVHLQDYEAAVPDFTRAIELHTKGVFPNGLYYRGYCYNKIGRFDLAIPDFSAALEVTTNPDLWSARGYSYLEIKDYANALSDYTNAIAMDKRTVEYYGSRAVCEYNLHHLKEAVQDAEKYLAKKPDNTDIIEIELRSKYEMNDYQGAEKMAEKLVLLKRTPLTWYYKGLIEYNLKEYEAGVFDFTNAIRMDSTYKDAYYSRGLCYLALNNDSGACPDLHKAEKLGFPGLKGKIDNYCKDVK